MTDLTDPRDMPGYYLNCFQYGADQIDEIELRNLKLQFDFNHRNILQGAATMGERQMMPITDTFRLPQ